MDDAVQQYIDAIHLSQRPTFDRIHRLVLTVQPEAKIVISYQIPTFVCGTNRLYVGAWKNWVSLYGWGEDDGGFAERHPELLTGRGTIQLRPAAAEQLSDDDLLALISAALS